MPLLLGLNQGCMGEGTILGYLLDERDLQPLELDAQAKLQLILGYCHQKHVRY